MIKNAFFVKDPITSEVPSKFALEVTKKIRDHIDGLNDAEDITDLIDLCWLIATDSMSVRKYHLQEVKNG